MKSTSHKTSFLCGFFNKGGDSDDFSGTCPIFDLDWRKGLYLRIPRGDEAEVAYHCQDFSNRVEGVTCGEFLIWRTIVALIERQRIAAENSAKIERLLRWIAATAGVATVLQAWRTWG